MTEFVCVGDLENWSMNEACQEADLECNKLMAFTSTFNKMDLVII